MPGNRAMLLCISFSSGQQVHHFSSKTWTLDTRVLIQKEKEVFTVFYMSLSVQTCLVLSLWGSKNKINNITFAHDNQKSNCEWKNPVNVDCPTSWEARSYLHHLHDLATKYFLASTVLYATFQIRYQI